MEGGMDHEPFSTEAGTSNADEEPIWASYQSQDDEDRTTAEKDELYAIMNLSKDCSQEDIKKSFKRLAALLHPDRHPDQKHKAAADISFQRLQRAFDVLSDPKKRTVYDALGEEGLKTTWEVGSKHKSPAELRAEFERLGRKQLEANVEQLVKSKGELTSIVDARVLLLSDDERRALGGPSRMNLIEKMNTVSIKQLFLKHSFTTPLSATTSVVMTSQLLARQGAGGGNVLLKLITRPTSKLALEIGTTVLQPRQMSFKATYAPDPLSFATLEFPLKTLAQPPPLSLTIGRTVTERATATFNVRTGAYSLGPWGRSFLEPISSSTITLGLIDQRGWSIHASTGLIAANVSVDYGRTVLGGVKFRIGVTGTSQGGLSTFVSGERRVTESVKGALALDMAMNGVMTLKISAIRLGQKVTIPVIVASSFNSTLAATITIIPALSAVALNHFVVAPRKRRKVSGRISELRRENEAFILEKREEAKAAVALLEEHVRRKVASEQACDGLIVTSSLYGILEATDSVEKEGIECRCIDVTGPMQALVNSSQLNIPAGRSKSNLLGFYDCAMGEKKRILIRYTFKGRLHSVEVEDMGAVAMPLRAHLVE